jgi:MtrB/PioB family decaheme-associated outer membrane protein
MRINASSVARLLAGGMLAIGTPSAGRTQAAPTPTSTPKPTSTITVAGEIGPRSYPSKLDPLAIGKFEEYRDMRARNDVSPLIEQLLLKYTPADSFSTYSLSARKLFDRDQSMWLEARHPGSYDFQLRWDRIPHTYSSTARSPGDELSNPGFNTLPAVRPDSNAWRNAPYIGAIRNQLDAVKASLTLTPNTNLDFKADYTRIGKKGGIPRSISFSGSTGPQREFVSPIDQTINDVRLSQGFASGDRSDSEALSFIKSYQVNVSYAYSQFQNALSSTMVDNPQLSVSSPTNGTATARVSLEPDNSAQTASATAAILFPLRTRVTGSVTTSWSRQNDAFLAQTSNDSLKKDLNYGLVGTLLRPSLEGKAQTQTYNISATTHPISRLTLRGRYRSFDLSNQTPPFSIKAMVVSDRSVALADSEKFEAHPFTKTNTDVSAAYDLARGLALTAAYGWEDWKRDPEVRNVEKTSEKMPRVSLDYTAPDWFSLRASYSSGSKRGNTYIESGTEILNFRRFDEADRDRKAVTAMGSLFPSDQITIGLTYQLSNDKFPNSQYGIQSAKSSMDGVDMDWSPTDRFSASAGYTLENVRDFANYRYRTGAVGSVTYDNPSYKWTNTNKDRNTTMFALANVTLVPDRLDLAASWSVINSHWFMFNANPNVPTGGNATQNLAATAQDWPEVKQRLEPVMLALQYRYSNDWAMTFRYQWEKYDQTDFRTVAPVFTTSGLNLAPQLPVAWGPGDLPGTIGQVAGSNTGQYHFLGNNYHPYSVNWLTLTIRYQPSAIPFRRGRSTL